MGSGSSDECYLCGEVVDPFDNLQGDRLPDAGRSWYRCEGEHPSGGDFYWWSDRIDGTIVERIAFDPSQPMMGQPIPLDRAYPLRRMAEEPEWTTTRMAHRWRLRKEFAPWPR